jgi:K+-transporting ATPase ATPase A chain
MTTNGLLQIGLYLVVLLALAGPLGAYMARVYEGKPSGLDRALGPLERLIYRSTGVRPDQEMDWKIYARSVLLFSVAGWVFIYALQRLQGLLPANPQSLGAVTPDSAFNTATSFVTNTNWQGYGGETTLSYLTQMVGLTVQNFVSAAAGMAVLVAFIRGLARRNAATIGNFWADLTRSTIYILLPLSLILALVLVSFLNSGLGFSLFSVQPFLMGLFWAISPSFNNCSNDSVWCIFTCWGEYWLSIEPA